MIGKVSFVTSDAGLNIATAIPVLSEGQVVPELEMDSSQQFWHVWAAQQGLDKALAENLGSSCEYPVDWGKQLAISLHWERGLGLLTHANVTTIKLSFRYDTCPLLPEYHPVDSGDDQKPVWLDQLKPIVRTLDHAHAPRGRRLTPNDVAIIHQDAVPFREWARNLGKVIQQSGPMGIHIFSGKSVGVGITRGEKLFDIFRRHRAVVFIGHSKRQDDGRGGWLMYGDEVLTMQELAAYLGLNTQANGSEHQRVVHSELAVPELVFAHCCYSAGGDEGGLGESKLSYPKLFLDAGVKYFVGTGRDVIYDANQEIPRLIAENFMGAWCADPDRAVQHLYDAKKALGFPLVSGLYQIYSYGDVLADKRPQMDTYATVATQITTDDLLGPYNIVSEVWADPHSRTWLATKSGQRGCCFVEVPNDEWQSIPEFGARLQESVQRLRSAALSSAHLIPDRVETLDLHHRDRPRGTFVALVYELPEGMRADQWTTLQTIALMQPGSSEAHTLAFAASVCAAIAEMHEHGLLHGNLCEAAVAVVQEDDGATTPRPLIRAAWAGQCQPTASVWSACTPPEEVAVSGTIDDMKRDCWGLGRIIYTLTTGQAPPDVSQSNPEAWNFGIEMIAPHAPVVLDRVVRELLVPSAALRPDAAFVAHRLVLALRAGGLYLGTWEQDVADLLAAGCRLIAVPTDDIGDVERALDGLRHRGHPVFVAAEGLGLVDRNTGRVVVPWISDAAVTADYREQGLPDPTPAEISLTNGVNILSQLEIIPVPACQIDEWGPVRNMPLWPIVMIRGNYWWDLGVGSSRMLKRLQERPWDSPAVILADRSPAIEEELAGSFAAAPIPPPPPAVLFEQILSFPVRRNLSKQPLEVPVASRLAEGLANSTRREVEDCLRLAWAQYDAIDSRVLEIREAAREPLYNNRIAFSYVPLSRLPDPEYVGLTPALARELSVWAEHLGAASEQKTGAEPLRRVLIVGPSASGKTTVAQSIARRLARPLVVLHPGQCLQSTLGGSEAMLRKALWEVSRISGCVVLLDDIQRSFAGAADAGNANEDTLERMSGILLNWLDNLPEQLIVVMTTTSTSLLPAQWRWRVQKRFDIPGGMDEDYRQAVFAASLRRFRLEAVASEAEITSMLARETHPQTRRTPLPSPAARASKGSLRTQQSTLSTPADIAAWVQETLRLHSKAANPNEAGFWLDAIQPL